MTARAYGLAVILSLVLLIVGNWTIDRISGERILNYRAAREMDHLSLAARALSDRLSMSLTHFRTLSSRVALGSIPGGELELMEALALEEGNHLPALLDLSWVGYDGMTHFHSSKNRSIFHQAMAWGGLYMGRHFESWRDGWVAPFTLSPGLKTSGLVYPLWRNGAFLGVLVVTLDLELLIGHIFHHVAESGDSWIVDGLGQVMFSKDPSEVGKNLFFDGALSTRLGYLGETVQRSHGKDVKGLVVWHGASVQTRKLVLIKKISPLAPKDLLPYRGVLSILISLGIAWLTSLFMVSRERAWEQLAIAESRYLAVVEAQTELVIRFQPDWTVTFVNQAYCRFFSLPKEKIVGESLRKFLPQEDRRALRSVLREMSADQPKESHWNQGLLDSTRWVKWNLSLVPGAWSAGSEIQAVGRDVTAERLISRQIMEEREFRYRRILESIGDAVLLCRRGEQGYQVDLANPAAEEVTGRKATELLGLPISTLFNSTSLGKIESHLSNSTSPISLTGGLRRTWGENIPVDINLMVFKDDGPTVLIVMRDISERIKASARERAYARQLRNLIGRLDRLDQEKGREMASYLHDVVGQNLASVKISLGLAKRFLGPEAEVLDGALSLVNQVIDDTRAMTFELASPLLDELGLVPALERLSEKLKEDHDLSVHISCHRALDDLTKAERELLFRAIRELLINVVKHGHTGRARVKLFHSGSKLVAVVSDRGIGYDPKDLDRWTTNSFGLFGLKERLAQAGGELVCRSAPGKGTVAMVIIKRGD